ncbi:MAG: hypothetical protein K2J15_06225, partial [Muribaculaceae bacterium]|nr:hypothetical protein [Muribaculaceae bacterium]
RYSVQSALGPGQNHYLEARVAPGSLRKYSKMDFRTSIFGSVKVIKEENKSPVSLVAHFIKSRDTTSLSGMRSLRHGDYRERIWKKDFKHLMRSLEVVDNGNSPALTGIDAASCELGCRPEVLAPFFRSARSGGIRNVTYHVGEDFYDVVDGLRAIDEALEFLEMRNGDRLGHAIAMGVDVSKYYSWRHRYLIIPMQELLDNVVWMKFRAMELNVSLHPSTMLFIMDCYTSLTEELGYGTSLSDALYWQGMKMRGENPIGREIPAERQGKMVERLLDTYWNQVSTRKSGERTKSIRVPSSYVEDVIKLQEGMLGKVESKGVFIETNPTSNMRIGGFERYTDLPLFRFHSPGEGGWKLPVSINTDDKGVFATSLRNEYSLIAAAMWKEKDAQGDRRWNDREIMDYLKRIADYGNMSRFR